MNYGRRYQKDRRMRSGIKRKGGKNDPLVQAGVNWV